MKDKQKATLIILGIVAVLAIIGLVLLFKSALTGGFVRAYPPAAQAVKYPTDIAREYCALPEPRLDLTQEECRRIAWAQCQEMHGTETRITMCQTVCGHEVTNICRKASGNYGIGLRYTYEPWLGLRRPTNDN